MVSRISALTLAWLLLPLSSALAVPPSKDYELLFEDAFQGNAVNESDWSYRLGERGGLISKHQFGYGYYETLSKPFMGGHGVHSAFWQSGGTTNPNNVFEIDGYEIDSRGSLACHNLYIHLSPKQYKEVPWVHRAQVPLKLNADGSYLSSYEYTPEGVVFDGHGKFYFFDRNVGFGDAISVAFTTTPDRRANTAILARMPKTGDAGWAVQLTDAGQVVFRIGSAARQQAVVAEADYQAGKTTQVACVFDRGAAKVYINGVLKKTASNVPYTTKDATAAGRLGAVSNAYEAIGDVVVAPGDEHDPAAKKSARYEEYKELAGKANVNPAFGGNSTNTKGGRGRPRRS